MNINKSLLKDKTVGIENYSINALNSMDIYTIKDFISFEEKLLIESNKKNW